MNELSIPQLVRAARAFAFYARAGSPPELGSEDKYNALFYCLADSALTSLGKFTSGELAEFVWAFVALKVTHRTLFVSALARTREVVGSFTSKEVCVTLSSDADWCEGRV